MKKRATNWLDSWVSRNSWAILTMIIALAIWGATLAGRVQAAEEKIGKLEELITQVVILQEQYKTAASNISEMKADIKEIKAAVK